MSSGAAPLLSLLPTALSLQLQAPAGISLLVEAARTMVKETRECGLEPGLGAQYGVYLGVPPKSDASGLNCLHGQAGPDHLFPQALISLENVKRQVPFRVCRSLSLDPTSFPSGLRFVCLFFSRQKARVAPAFLAILLF